MILFDFLDTSLYWLIAVAAIGLAVMVIFALLAAMLRRGSIAAWVSRALSKAPTLRGRLLIGLILVGAIPVLTLPPILMVENVRTRQLELADELRSDASNLAHGMERSIRQYTAGIDALAEHINTLDSVGGSTLNGWLLRHHKANPEFVSTWIARPDGNVVAATAMLEGDQKPWIGPIGGVALLDFFQASVENGGLYVSPVQKGVEPLFDPMIIISAPIFFDGREPWGFIQTQLNLRRVYRNVVSFESIPGRPALLTDTRNRLMVASPEIAFDKFQNISSHPIVLRINEARGGIYGFEAPIEKGQPSARYLTYHTRLASGWNVYAIASIQGMQTQALIFMGLSLVWVLIVAFLAVNLAGVYGSIVDDPLQALHQSMDIFDAEHTLKMVPKVPKDAPAEIASVFRRLRMSMEKSRDSYRNMLRAISEGEQLRRKLRTGAPAQAAAAVDKSPGKPAPAPKVGGAGKADTGKAARKNAPEKKAAQKQAVPGYKDRLDPLTGLAGREIFKEFFGDAWMLGYSDSRPLSLLIFSIGFGEARAKSQGGNIDDTIFKTAGKVLNAIAGRELDFVARIDADRFVLVLPDTDLYGALVVAERARTNLHDALPESSGGKVLGANVGVAAITPTPAGDAASFIKAAQRVLVMAEKKDSSHLAYLDEKLKTHVLKHGDAIPTAPTAGAILDGLDDAQPDSGSGSSEVELALAETYVASSRDGGLDPEAAPGGAANLVPESAPASAPEPAPPAESEAEDPTVYATWSEGEIDLDDIDWED